MLVVLYFVLSFKASVKIVYFFLIVLLSAELTVLSICTYSQEL